ncbi:Fur family transcriptional regulator [Campylobacter curvus]|uniref:Fur family transcriptional regulator n=1 Tax=Campylobacter curvus TaxID=200 RepID=UPI0014701248|nr:transcriptional repressor [Campylobacter curvus]
MENFERFYQHLSSFMSEFNHKNSHIKENILSILYRSQTHLSAQDIQTEFSKIYAQNISLPTIYALLNFLDECRLCNTYDDSGIKKYELNLKAHHDHLICEKCGKVVEFHDEDIEQRQELICKEKNFEEVAHTMVLYGVCADCQKTNG